VANEQAARPVTGHNWPMRAAETVAAIGSGQGWRQVGELMLAFVLASSIGLERQLRGKAAGLRTQAIVGTSAALILLVSKYGFSDVLVSGYIVLDPSRVAAQIVSGVGFLGAGLILTRRGAVQGLTTAAAVWETAAIGMAAGAGLGLLALIVTALHFVTVFGYTALARRLPGSRTVATRIRVVYVDQQGVLRRLLQVGTASGWTVTEVRPDPPGSPNPETGQRPVAVTLGLAGTAERQDLLSELAAVPGVTEVEVVAEEDLD
jgi:putative Mg2+ transporter-C (MgtC) family protein